MKKEIVTLLFIATSLAIVLGQKKTVAKGVTIDNHTQSYSPEFITAFRNFINSASAFFRNDTGKKLQYIADGLNKNYPASNRRYAIFQENETVAWQIKGWVNYNPFSIASLAKGVDLLNANISYMLSVDHNFEPAFIGQVGQKGSGLTKVEEHLITQIILHSED